MSESPSAMRELAQTLLTYEKGALSNSNTHLSEAGSMCEKLQLALTRFAGPEGFTSLLRRALSLSRTEAPTLNSIKVNTNGSIEGLDELSPNDAVVLITRLLELLAQLIGERLTKRLVYDAWPDLAN